MNGIAKVSEMGGALFDRWAEWIGKSPEEQAVFWVDVRDTLASAFAIGLVSHVGSRRRGFINGFIVGAVVVFALEQLARWLWQ